MALTIRRSKFLTLLGCSVCSCWSVLHAVPNLRAEDQSQFRISDSSNPAPSGASEASSQALIGPSGPIHSVPAAPHPMPSQPTVNHPRRPVAQAMPVAAANRGTNPINLMGLEVVGNGSGQVASQAAAQPAPKTVAQIPGKLVLQNLKAPSAPASSEMPNSLGGPINVLPMTPAPQESMPAGKGLLNTAEMVGQLADNTFLFSKLNIPNDMDSKLTIPKDFRMLPAQLGANIRSQTIEPGLDTAWFNQAFTWAAPAFYHNPLYFEQPNLERYGIGPRRLAQPALSSAHFFGSFVLMPYKVLTQHPCEKVYTLGHCRPGNLVPVQQLTLVGQSYPGEVHKYWEKYSGYR